MKFVARIGVEMLTDKVEGNGYLVIWMIMDREGVKPRLRGIRFDETRYLSPNSTAL